MYDERLTRLMDQVMLSCLVIMSILFFNIKIQKKFLDITLPPTPPPEIEYDYNIKAANLVIKNISFLSKKDLTYLKFYDPQDAIYIIKYSNQYHIPIVYLYRQDYLESKLGKYPIHIRENGMDLGFKQLNSKYLDYYVERYYELEEPFDPMNHEHSIQIGCAYLRDLYEQFFCDWKLAFQAYNAGPTRVKSFLVPPVTEEYAQCILNGYSPDLKYIEVAARGMH